MRGREIPLGVPICSHEISGEIWFRGVELELEMSLCESGSISMLDPLIRSL